MNKEIENSQTFLNLKKSFEEEAALYFRYKFFLSISSFEGLKNTTQLLQDFIDSSVDNVLGNFDFLRNIKDPASMVEIGETQKNIISLLLTELEQSQETYPIMAKIAREEGLTDIASWFETLEKLKRIHVLKLQGIQNE